MKRLQDWIRATGRGWPLISALVGYLVIHPAVMVLGSLMLNSKVNHGAGVTENIFSGLQRSFSIEMAPWGFSFAVICAITGGFFGRNLRISAQLRESERRYRKLSITDDLTRLNNSRHFSIQLEAEIDRTNRYRHPLSLLIIDLDDFKQYNDTYGHLAGDKILKTAGEILQSSLRKTDSAYRYGGEEFAVILPESEGDESLNFAERIRQTFESRASLTQPAESYGITVSIGVAQYIPGEDITTFIKRADKNMYIAKKNGKNRIFYHPEHQK